MNRNQAINFLECEAHDIVLPENVREIAEALRVELRKLGLWFVYTKRMETNPAEKAECPLCGQFDFGQTGEYPCRVCGVPAAWDERE